MLESSFVLGVPSAGFAPPDDGGTMMTPILNLRDLYEHNAIEHDASIVRHDEYFEPLSQFDSTLFENLIEHHNNSSTTNNDDSGNNTSNNHTYTKSNYQFQWYY